MASELFKKLLSELPLSTKIEVALSMRITLRIRELMRKQNMTQSELCQKREEDLEEINLWLSGMHTFTTKMLAKLHIVLGEPISQSVKTLEKRPKSYHLLQLFIKERE